MKFSNEFDLKLQEFPANWDRYGRRAGYMRNVDMAQYAVQDDAYPALIAFWDGQSKGTKHMIGAARRMKIETHVVSYKH